MMGRPVFYRATAGVAGGVSMVIYRHPPTPHKDNLHPDSDLKPDVLKISVEMFQENPNKNRKDDELFVEDSLHCIVLFDPFSEATCRCSGEKAVPASPPPKAIKGLPKGLNSDIT